MKRWEQFNQICGTSDSLQEQIQGILQEKICRKNNVCVAGLGKHIKEWLEEEVEE